MGELNKINLHRHGFTPEQITGFLTMEDCLSAIARTGINMYKDNTSIFINEKRIESMRSLLDLFETYNRMIALNDN